MIKVLGPIFWIVAFQAVSGLIGYYTNADMDAWYQALEKSNLTPAPYIFPIVWSTLYAMIALSGYLTWTHRDTTEGRHALCLFAAYVVANWLWSFIFFTFQLTFGAFIWLVLINALAIVYMMRAWEPSQPSSVLMIPSLVWTLFATYLSFMIWQLN